MKLKFHYQLVLSSPSLNLSVAQFWQATVICECQLICKSTNISWLLRWLFPVHSFAVHSPLEAAVTCNTLPASSAHSSTTAFAAVPPFFLCLTSQMSVLLPWFIALLCNCFVLRLCLSAFAHEKVGERVFPCLKPFHAGSLKGRRPGANQYSQT